MKTSIALVSLFTAALAYPSLPPDAPHIRLARRRLAVRDQGTVDIKEYLGNLQYTLQKYGQDVTIIKGLKDVVKRAGGVGEEPEKDQGDDELYYGNVKVGKTSPQTFTIDFDTGSSDFFVPGPKCTKSKGCSGTVRYDQDGTNEGNTTTITYGSGEVTGENYYDSVTVAGLTATHQNVISLTTASGFSTSDAEGLMGMAFESIAESKQPPFFQTLIAEGKVAKPEFAFYLGRKASGTGDDSQLTLGGTDPSKYTTTPHKVPLTAETYWQVGVEHVVVNGDTLLDELTKGNAAIDTGTTIVLAPSVAATDIYARIPGSVPIPLAEGGVEPIIFAYPCDSHPKVSFGFAGENFNIAAQDFNLGKLTAELGTLLGNSTLTTLLDGLVDYCLGAVAGDDIDPTEELYVVGDTFLKNWYAIFNHKDESGKPSVNFAKSVDWEE